MDFQYTEDQLQFRNLAAEFARDRLAPNAGQWDESHHFPIECLREAAALGFSGMTASEEINGANLSRLAAAMIYEQLATGCIATTAFLSIHNMVTNAIDHYADEALRQYWGPKLVAMDAVASYCLTEPNSGSDAASLSTRAERDGDYYILNGAKAFISGGSVSDVYLSMVRTGGEGHKGISCLLVEKGTPGLSFGKLEQKMGWNAQPTSAVYFENCRVPISQRVGPEGIGFKIALNALNGGRINIAACSLGGALACIKHTQHYLHDRHQFGKSLTEMQALRFYFSDMLTEFEAARLMVYRAADALDKELPDAPLYSAMAKRFATDVCFKIVDKAMQLHGGYGYLHEYPIERIFRDLRVHRILEGTNEIMREIISKTTLSDDYLID